MALNARSDQVVTPYPATIPPAFPDSFPQYFRAELQRLKATLDDLTDAAPQTAEIEPSKPRRGMVRYAVSPWNPGSGDGLYVYNGTSWVHIV
jgi:hypothetical protein